MPPRTRTLFVVQGNYGQGWEDLTASYTRKEAWADLTAYRQNAPEPVRVIRRRERIPR
jgi:aspartate aminotransferase-like enzyme